MAQDQDQSALILNILEPEETNDDECFDCSDFVRTVVLFSRGHRSMAESAMEIQSDFFRALEWQESDTPSPTPDVPEADSRTDSSLFRSSSESSPWMSGTQGSQSYVNSIIARAVKSMDGSVPTFVSIVGSDEFDQIVSDVPKTGDRPVRWAQIDFLNLYNAVMMGTLLDRRSMNNTQPSLT